MRTTVILAALFAAASGPALAQAVADPAKAEAGAYAIEPNHTRLRFDVSHFGFTKYDGEFRGVTGTLNLDPADPTASKVDISVATDSVAVPNAKLHDELVGDKWLDAAKYPDITFKSNKVTRTGDNTADVAGDFTLHGVTKPLTLHVTFNAAGTNPANRRYTSGFEARGRIMRTDFGVKALTPMIGDAVDIDIDAAFEKAK